MATDDLLQQMGCIEARYLRIRAMVPFTDNLLDPTVLPAVGAEAELKAGLELRTRCVNCLGSSANDLL